VIHGAPGHGVRRAGPEDAQRLDRIVREVHGSEAWSIFGMTAADVIAHQDHRVYLATSEGRAVGCVIASSREYTMLHSLSVLRPYRGRNHAAAMIRAAVAEADADWAVSGLVATVTEHDRSGRDRFVRLGFRQLPNYVNQGLIAFALSVPGTDRK
jgi:GNAT superfamily N-acetyltransferase